MLNRLSQQKRSSVQVFHGSIQEAAANCQTNKTLGMAHGRGRLELRSQLQSMKSEKKKTSSGCLCCFLTFVAAISKQAGLPQTKI